MIVSRDGRFYAKGSGEDLFADVGVVLRGYFDCVRQSHGEEEAQNVIVALLKCVDDDLKEDGFSLDLFDDDEEEEGGIDVPSDVFKKFMEGGDLLF